MILLFPPAAKPCEPPVGLARLVGTLRHHGVPVKAIDMNLEGFRYLYEKEISPEDQWTNRAIRKRESNLDLLMTPAGYENQDRYKNAVLDINRILKAASEPFDSLITLANFKHNRLSPLKSSDLLYAADHPEENIYYPYFKKRIDDLAVETGGLDTVGISLVYLNQALSAFSIIGYLKKRYPKTRILLGGGLISSWMKKPDWHHPFDGIADVIIEGEGERPLLRLYGIEEFDSCTLPDYSDFVSNAYLSPGPLIPYCTSNGCYWKKCGFCPEKAENNPYTPVPVNRAVEHLNRLAEIHKPALFHLVDNAVSPALMARLSKSGFSTPWYAFTRVTPQLANPEFCHNLSRSGCRLLCLGLESGDKEVLHSMNKGLDLALFSKAVKALKNAGIRTYIYLLFGTPAESEKAAHRTMEFVADHSPWIDFLNVAVFNMPYFAPETKIMGTRQFYDGDLSLYTEFDHPLGWNRNEIRSFLSKKFRRHPNISPIIHSDPPVFNANHAAFF